MSLSEDLVSGVEEYFGSINRRSKSDLYSKHAALQHYRDFCERKNISLFLDAENVLIDDSAESIICTKDRFSEVANYLLFHTLQKNSTGDKLMTKTAVGYFGIIKEYIRKIFERNPIWINHDTAKGQRNNEGGWFTIMGLEMVKKGNIASIEEGISIENKATPVGRQQVSDIVNYYLIENNYQSFLKGFYVSLTFNAIGRAGELSWASLSLTEWNFIENILYCEWNEHKTARQSAMNFYPDHHDYRLDVYFLFGIYFMFGAGSAATTKPTYLSELTKRKVDQKSASYIFPTLITNASQIALRCVSDLKGKIESLPANGSYTAKSLLYGGLQEVVCATGDEAAGVFRGGWWNHRYEHTYHAYMSGCLTLLRRAGMAISGFSKFTDRVYGPSMTVIFESLNEEDKSLLKAFMKELFITEHNYIEQFSLQLFADMMFASILRYLEDFAVKYSKKHFIVLELLLKGRDYNYTYEIFITWGSMISEYIRKNY